MRCIFLFFLLGPQMCFTFSRREYNFPFLSLDLLVKYDLDMILTAFTRFSLTSQGSAGSVCNCGATVAVSVTAEIDSGKEASSCLH